MGVDDRPGFGPNDVDEQLDMILKSDPGAASRPEALELLRKSMNAVPTAKSDNKRATPAEDEFPIEVDEDAVNQYLRSQNKYGKLVRRVTRR